jgi:hypothetical protein
MNNAQWSLAPMLFAPLSHKLKHWQIICIWADNILHRFQITAFLLKLLLPPQPPLLALAAPEWKTNSADSFLFEVS